MSMKCDWAINNSIRIVPAGQKSHTFMTYSSNNNKEHILYISNLSMHHPFYRSYLFVRSLIPASTHWNDNKLLLHTIHTYSRVTKIWHNGITYLPIQLSIERMRIKNIEEEEEGREIYNQRTTFYQVHRSWNGIVIAIAAC